MATCHHAYAGNACLPPNSPLLAPAHTVFKQCLLTFLTCPGISEPLPVAATFYMPDASGKTMEGFAHIDTMVCPHFVLGICKGLPSLSKPTTSLQVTVVDASNLMTNFENYDLLVDRQVESTDIDKRSVVNLLVDQIEFADVLVLNKVDLVPSDEVSKIASLLHRLNPTATVMPVERCEVPIHSILNTKR